MVASSMLLGTAGTALVLAPDPLDPTDAAAWRAVIGASVLAGTAAVRRRRFVRGGLSWGWTSVGGVAFAVNQIAFFAAIDRLGVASGTLITVAVIPIAAGVVEWLTAGHVPPTGWWVGTAVALIGVWTLTIGGAAIGLRPGGLAAAVVAGVTAALVVWSAQNMTGAVGPHLAMTAIVSVGALLVLPRAIVSFSILGSSRTLATVLWLGVVTLALAYLLIGVGVSRHSLSTVSTTTLLEPAFATVLAVTVAGESADIRVWSGMAMVVAGVWLASRQRVTATESAAR